MTADGAIRAYVCVVFVLPSQNEIMPWCPFPISIIVFITRAIKMLHFGFATKFQPIKSHHNPFGRYWLYLLHCHVFMTCLCFLITLIVSSKTRKQSSKFMFVFYIMC